MRLEAAKAVNIPLTLRNWLIGRYIAEYELRGGDRATYGENLLEELASALVRRGVSNTGHRQLYRYISFYRTYPQISRALPAKLQVSTLPASLGKKSRAAAREIGDSSGALDWKPILHPFRDAY